MAFAQARAGASHPVEAVTSTWRSSASAGRRAAARGRALDPVGLMARALGAWAAEHTAASSCAIASTPRPVLASSGYVRERVRELHDQCRALAISPPMTFGALVVQLELGALRATERMEVRAAAGRVPDLPLPRR